MQVDGQPAALGLLDEQQLCRQGAQAVRGGEASWGESSSSGESAELTGFTVTSTGNSDPSAFTARASKCLPITWLCPLDR